MKKFFQKVKLDSKFKSAGEGHRLTDDSTNRSGASSSTGACPPIRKEPMSESQVNAAIAAMERMDKSKPPTSKRVKLPEDMPNASKSRGVTHNFNEAARSPEQETYEEPYSVEGVKFVSGLTGEVMQESELFPHYKETLLLRLGTDENVEVSATMIHTLNKDRTKVDVCVKTISRYIDNIVANEGEEKYRKIRKENKVFSEKVATVNGAEEFLNAVGFKLTSVKTEEKEELYFILPTDANMEKLKESKERLLSTVPIKSKLFRDARIFKPSDHAMRFNLPNSFFNLSIEEVRREQGLLTEEVELNKQLRTKAMRERPKSGRRYKFALIRVRFPDGFILQGTFNIYEKFSEVRSFVSSNITVDWAPYVLKTSLGKTLDKENETLLALSLVPSVVLNLSWFPEVQSQLQEQGQSLAIKPELLENLEILS